MFERLTARAAALAQRGARRRREALARRLSEEAPEGVGVSEEEEGVLLAGRGLGRRLALDPELRWLTAGRGR